MAVPEKVPGLWVKFLQGQSCQRKPGEIYFASWVSFTVFIPSDCVKLDTS